MRAKWREAKSRFVNEVLDHHININHHVYVCSVWGPLGALCVPCGPLVGPSLPAGCLPLECPLRC